MEDIFGTITPFALITLVTLLTQYIKNTFKLEGWKTQIPALVMSFAFIVPFELFTADKITAIVVFKAIVYSLLGWASAIGVYEVASKSALKK